MHVQGKKKKRKREKQQVEAAVVGECLLIVVVKVNGYNITYEHVFVSSHLLFTCPLVPPMIPKRRFCSSRELFQKHLA